MANPFATVPAKLRFAVVMSTLWLMLMPLSAAAHEVTPTIADLSVVDQDVVLDLRLNVEAFVAGLDLDGLENTDAADENDRYDGLRAMTPEALEPEVRRFADVWLSQLRLSGAGPVLLRVGEITIAPVGDVELARATHLVLRGALPAGSTTLVLDWPKGSGDLVLRQQGVAEPFTGYISGGNSSAAIPVAGGAQASGWQVFADYIPVGFDHILPKGLDHILFVLGLFFLSIQLGALLWQISAFTLAHTVTLAMGAMGWVNVPGSIVEPLIAASIAFVAIENILVGRLYPWRPAVVFGFGLLHGLGFASVLGEFGLPEGQLIPALIGFNVGVELGQLTVIAMAFFAVGLWFGKKEWYRARIAVPASAVIAVIGIYWVYERVFL
ncbi:MAG: HupE/UreJ family protein [Sedimentitalea sp.]